MKFTMAKRHDQPKDPYEMTLSELIKEFGIEYIKTVGIRTHSVVRRNKIKKAIARMLDVDYLTIYTIENLLEAHMYLRHKRDFVRIVDWEEPTDKTYEFYYKECSKFMKERIKLMSFPGFEFCKRSSCLNMVVLKKSEEDPDTIQEYNVCVKCQGHFCDNHTYWSDGKIPICSSC